MKYPPPICLHCVHLEAPPPQQFMRCEAFPDGIPEHIWKAEIEHRESYPGDRGIQFADGSPMWQPPA
jgi:hypothetical protein